MGRFALGLAVAMSTCLAATQARAADHEVRMLTRGPTGSMVFEPAFLKIGKGDTVTFKPVDAGHNAESIPAMTPAGAASFKGDLSKPVSVTFSRNGLYGYECRPHVGLGMVGLVQVGDKVDKTSAAAAAGKLPGLARIRMKALVAAIR